MLSTHQAILSWKFLKQHIMRIDLCNCLFSHTNESPLLHGGRYSEPHPETVNSPSPPCAGYLVLHLLNNCHVPFGQDSCVIDLGVPKLGTEKWLNKYAKEQQTNYRNHPICPFPPFTSLDFSFLPGQLAFPLCLLSNRNARHFFNGKWVSL